MARSRSTQLTEVEMQVLQVLWDQGPSPVREIHNRLTEVRDTNYSTTVKMLSVMLDKGLLVRDEDKRPHVYSAVVTRRKAQKNALSQLVSELYEGSTTSLVMQALSSKKASADEIKQIRELLDKLEDQQ